MGEGAFTPPADPLKLLDKPATRRWLIERGVNCTERQIHRWFEKRFLPVFPGPDGRKLFTTEEDLEAHFRRLKGAGSRQTP